VPTTNWLNLPTGPNGTWDNDPNTGPINAEIMSYNAIKDAFSHLLYGVIDEFGPTSSAFIMNTRLMYTDELKTVAPAAWSPPKLGPPNFLNRNLTSLRESSGPLIDALEKMFENITISMLSEPYLQ
jgi:hypothetical protein